MASENFQGLVFSTGRLVKSPTAGGAPAGSFPYGGTALGLARDVMVSPSQMSYEVRAEEWGQTVVEVLDLGRTWVVGCFFRGADDDVVRTLFPGMATLGGVSGKYGIVDRTNTPNRGRLLSSSAVPLLFVPDDVRRHNMVYLPAAVPLVEESAELALKLGEEFGYPALFMALPSAAGITFRMQLHEDISLT